MKSLFVKCKQILERIRPERLKAKSIKKAFRKVIHHLDVQERFTQIYQINYWGSDESASGKGSTLEHTNNLRKQLPYLLKQFSIEKIFDGPCGDFYWMQHVLQGKNVEYIGADIVKPLIEQNNQTHGNSKISFIHIDLRRDQLPYSDLMICRDCIFHLSYEDTTMLLKNYISSKIPYLLTTTYVNHGLFINRDITSGHFRLIDLFSPPYNFPKEVLFKIDDWIQPNEERWMCLWSREQLIEPISRL